MQGASKQYRQRPASTSTSSVASGGGKSAKFRTSSKEVNRSPALAIVEIPNSKFEIRNPKSRPRRPKKVPNLSDFEFRILSQRSRLFARQPLSPAIFTNKLVVVDDLFSPAE